MRNHNVTIPELSMIAGTRAMIGAGVALLVADRLMPEQRRAIGWTLTFVGGLMTIPLALELAGAAARRRRFSRLDGRRTFLSIRFQDARSAGGRLAITTLGLDRLSRRGVGIDRTAG